MAGDAMILVITGPSGAGKTAIRRELVSNRNIPNLINVTTRKKRKGEIDGVDYLFVSRERFKEMVEQGELLEWVEYSGNYYGLKINGNMEGVTVLENEGALKIKSMFPGRARLVYLKAPEDLRRDRMLKRGDDPEQVEKRILADRERFEKSKFEENADLVIENIDFQQAVKAIEDYYYSL